MPTPDDLATRIEGASEGWWQHKSGEQPTDRERFERELDRLEAVLRAHDGRGK